LSGDAFTFVAPQEEPDLRSIERAIKRTLPRVTLSDFDYTARPQAKLEIPLAERIAAIRQRKAAERTRGHARKEERAQRPAGPPRRRGSARPVRRRG
jgi:ATP-dependent RNA helicase RhlE